jgi:hypothetical protein
LRIERKRFWNSLGKTIAPFLNFCPHKGSPFVSTIKIHFLAQWIKRQQALSPRQPLYRTAVANPAANPAKSSSIAPSAAANARAGSLNPLREKKTCYRLNRLPLRVVNPRAAVRASNFRPSASLSGLSRCHLHSP